VSLEPGTATRTRVSRRIAADPTSTALLLAGPTALELWPGLRRVAEVSGRVVVEADIHDAARAASVRALPPQRTPTSYLTRFEWAGPGLPATTGALTLGYAAPDDEDGEVGTTAELVLTSSGFEGTLLDESTLEEMARGFLANLAHAAEVRNRAA
jgi:hypothetical protein